MKRTALALGAGIGAAVSLEALLPTAESFGLRGILVVLPVVAAILVRVAWALRAPAWPLDERVGGLLVLGLVLGGDRLGLPATAGLTALALFALVGLRILRLAPRLRRAFGGSRWRAAWLAAAVPFAAYLLVLPWADAARPPNGDEPYYLLLAESLSKDLDVDLANQYREEAWRKLGDRPIEPQPGDPVGPRGEIYSRHDLFLPLLLAPFWALGGLGGARLALLFVSAALASATLFAARDLGAGGRGAFRAWGLAAFAPPVLMLSHQVWVEIPAALLVALALGALGRARAEGWQWTPRRGAAFALPLALLPLLKLRLLAVAAPLALLGLSGARARRGPRLAAVAAVALTAVSLLALNAWLWGNPLHMHSFQELALFELPLERFLRGGLGLGFDIAFGLCAATPLWLLAAPGSVLAPRRARVVALALAAFVPYFVLVASRREWYGGWSPAFRYGVVALPVLAAAVALVFDRRPRAGVRVAVACLAGLTVLRTAAVLVEPGWAYSLADGRAAVLDAATAGFAVDVARFLPSMVRPRPATWIVPSLLLAWIGVCHLLPRRRPRATAAAGVALLLVAWTGLLFAAAHVPTRVAHVEDPWIPKTGGRVWPNPWMIDRTRFDGGWALGRNESARIPVVAGSRRVELAVRWREIRGASPGAGLELLGVGGRLAMFPSGEASGWRIDRAQVDGWPPGAELELRYAIPPGGRWLGGVVVDRVEFDWR